MSDEGEKTCPLCAEEMDLTDQHLKPCKCGYEICVWCWHHIMDMAEKDDSEGRCPACRTPYNKEKIVGTASNCGRLVAEMSTEKKIRSNKGKSKTSEGRKQLSSVRVIQRNLVYVVGLPVNLADEDLLQRKEYFGQYGKVLKVSISRTTAGAIQQFANNTCSVYITYLKEEEAIRCIQSVHGFLLDGRQLRACFGTTKYCHAWLRSAPCTNPDCLYLHEIGSQEDSFTKDEIITAFSRSRVQQVTGATNIMQRRSGSVLPPPADEYCNSGCASSGKPITKNAAISSPCSLKTSPPNSSSGRSAAFPAGASWVTSGSITPSDGLHKQKRDSFSGPVSFSTVLASSNHTVSPYVGGRKSLFPEEENKLSREENKVTSEPGKEQMVADCQSQTVSSDRDVSPGHDFTTGISSKVNHSSISKDNYQNSSLQSNTNKPVKMPSESSGNRPLDDQKRDLDEKVKDACSGTSSDSLDRNQGLEEALEQYRKPDSPLTIGKSSASENEVLIPQVKSEGSTDSQSSEVEASLLGDRDDVLSFDDQRLRNPEVISNSTHFGDILHTPPSRRLRDYPGQLNDSSNLKDDSKIVDTRVGSISHGTPVLFSGYPENQFTSFAPLSKNNEHTCLSPSDDRTLNMRRFESDFSGFSCNSVSEKGENSIISDILSLDFDPWDESLTSQKLSKLLGETDKNQGSSKLSTPWKAQHNNQSRFSFAREEEHNPAPQFESPVNIDHALSRDSFAHDLNINTKFDLDKFGIHNGISLVNGEEHDFYGQNHSHFIAGKLPVSRSHILPPPGFSTPGKAPPPGFTPHERIEQQNSSSHFGSRMMDASALVGNQYPSPQATNVISNGDVEFIDPAILAVGRGRFHDSLNSPGLDLRSKISPQFSSFENNPRSQLLRQSSHNSLQNQGFDIGDPFTSLTGSFRAPSRVREQSIANRLISSYQGGNNLGMADLLRAERLGFNRFFGGYEDSKLRMSNQADLYNRTFGL